MGQQTATQLLGILAVVASPSRRSTLRCDRLHGDAANGQEIGVRIALGREADGRCYVCSVSKSRPC
jgi:hypothetical protein